MRNLKFIKGQSLFEVVVAIALIAMIATTIVALSTVSIRNNTFSRNNALANKYATEAMEWLRKERDTDWNTFYLKAAVDTGLTYCLQLLDWSVQRSCSDGENIKGYIREVIMISEPEKVNAKVNVTWTDSKGSHNVSLVTDFTNWK